MDTLFSKYILSSTTSLTFVCACVNPFPWLHLVQPAPSQTVVDTCRRIGLGQRNGIVRYPLLVDLACFGVADCLHEGKINKKGVSDYSYSPE